MVNKLPPLPGSDPISMKRWAVQDFWEGNEINKIEVSDFKKCEHRFKITPTGAKCRKCNFGLIEQSLEIKDEHLYHRGKLII